MARELGMSVHTVGMSALELGHPRLSPLWKDLASRFGRRAWVYLTLVGCSGCLQGQEH